MLSYSKLVNSPNRNDVLCGRGGKINNHVGNRQFRAIVETHKDRYQAASKAEKALIARQIIDEIRLMNPPGRFLSKSLENPSHWFEEKKEIALKKTSQALREGAPAYRAVDRRVNHDMKGKVSKRSLSPKGPSKMVYHQPMIQKTDNEKVKASLLMIEQLAARTRNGSADMCHEKEPDIQPLANSQKERQMTMDNPLRRDSLHIDLNRILSSSETSSLQRMSTLQQVSQLYGLDTDNDTRSSRLSMTFPRISSTLGNRLHSLAFESMDDKHPISTNEFFVDPFNVPKAIHDV